MNKYLSKQHVLWHLPFFISIIFFISFVPSVHAQVKILFDNPKHNFTAGEPITFKVSPNGGGMGNYEIYLNPRNPSASVILKGEFFASSGSEASITVRINRPEVAFIHVTHNGSNATEAFTVSPLSIQPLEPDPQDFDSYWQQQKQALAAVALNPQLNQIGTGFTGSKIYILELSSVDGRKVSGYLSVPAGGGKFPAILTLPPFGSEAIQPDPLIVSDFSDKGNAILLYISVHNAPINSVDGNAYKPDDLLRREGFYSHLMILAGLRAIDYLTSREDFNGSLGVTGNSQGAGLAVQVAGLDNRVTALMTVNAAACENDGERFGKASGFPYYIQAAKSIHLDTNIVYKNMHYYECAHFLKRFKGDVMFQLGFRDDVTPAATQYAAYNSHRGQSVVLNMREFGHNNPWEEYYLGQHAFFSQHLKGFKNTYYFNKQFFIDAGADININSNSANLSGSILIDGSANKASHIRWSKIEGPADVNFSNASSLQTTATFRQAGTYVLRLTADDDYKINDPNDPKYYTLSDYITVQVGQLGNPCDNDNDPPVFSNCPQNITVTTTENDAIVNWQIPTAIDNCSTPSVSSNLKSGQSLPLGTTTVMYTATDAKNNKTICQFNVLVKKVETAASDLGLTISTNVLKYVPYSIIQFKIVLKNYSATTFSTAQVHFKFPNGTVTGGQATISGKASSEWREWCSNNNQCFEWDVSNLSGFDSVTLTVPVYVFNSSTELVATTTLLASSPKDILESNNQATISIPINNLQEGIENQSFMLKRATVQLPISIELSPTVSTEQVFIDIFSDSEKIIQFDIVNALGTKFFTVNQKIEKAQNRIPLDISKLPRGIYFLIPLVKNVRNVPLKFIKI